MLSPLIVAVEYVEWRLKYGCGEGRWRLFDLVFECEAICNTQHIEFDAESATLDDVVEALALVWKHLDRTKCAA